MLPAGRVELEVLQGSIFWEQNYLNAKRAVRAAFLSETASLVHWTSQPLHLGTKYYAILIISDDNLPSYIKGREQNLNSPLAAVARAPAGGRASGREREYKHYFSR